MNESCHSLRFTGDGNNLFSIGDDGQLYIWDVRWVAEWQITTWLCMAGLYNDISGTRTAFTSSKMTAVWWGQPWM